ncbi:MAG: hypothetical protein IBX55_21250 [Methyloprofundus sp.]|nr:hypothetical protein [Methyloprofundus sp.]
MKRSDIKILLEINHPIRLEGLQPIGRGSHRICYPHPDHPDRCVKIMIAKFPPHTSEPGTMAEYICLSGAAPDENALEFKAYQELEKRGNSAIWRHIPRCYGMVSTDFGPGLVTDYIREVNGQQAESLAQRLDRSYDASCKAALVEFKSFLLEHLIRVGDLHPSNLLICRPDGTQHERLFIIDGLATRHFLWWPCFYPLRRFKVRSKIRRMDRRISNYLSRKQADAEKGMKNMSG